MTTHWQITAGVQRVDLVDGRAEVVFTVRNPGPVDDRATVEVVGSEQTQPSWFVVAERQRVVPHGGSVDFPTVLRPPPDAPAGAHWLAGRVYSADRAPEETSVTSNRVAFTVAAPSGKPKPNWWLWVLIAGLVAVVGVVLLVVLLGGDDEPSGPVLVDEGTVTVPVHGAVDVDKVQEVSIEESDAADFVCQFNKAFAEPELVPQNGAVFPNVEPAESEDVFREDCRHAIETKAIIRLAVKRAQYCVRTAKGNVALMTLVEPAVGQGLSMRIRTFAGAP